MRKTIDIEKIIEFAIAERRAGDIFRRKGDMGRAKICYASVTTIISIISLSFDSNKYSDQWKEVYDRIWID